MANMAKVTETWLGSLQRGEDGHGLEKKNVDVGKDLKTFLLRDMSPP